MKTYQEFITESTINSQVISESFADLLKFKKGQKVTAVLDNGTEVAMDVQGYNYATDGKLYNKGHAKFDSFDAFTSSVEDESIRRAISGGDAKALMAHGHTRIRAKANKMGEDNFALIGYQSGKESYGYQRTATMYNHNGKIAFVNSKGERQYVKAFK